MKNVAVEFFSEKKSEKRDIEIDFKIIRWVLSGKPPHSVEERQKVYQKPYSDVPPKFGEIYF